MLTETSCVMSSEIGHLLQTFLSLASLRRGLSDYLKGHPLQMKMFMSPNVQGAMNEYISVRVIFKKIVLYLIHLAS